MKSFALFLVLALALICPVAVSLNAPATPFGGTTLTLTSTTIAPVAMPVVNSPCGVNPYDNFDYAPLQWPGCNEGFHLDLDCVLDIEAMYAADCEAQIAAAKRAWNLACGARTTAWAYADAILANCAPGNQVQCATNHAQAVVAAQVAFNSAVSGIATGLGIALDDLAAEWFAKLLDCCVPD